MQGVFRGGEFVPSPHGRILRVHSGTRYRRLLRGLSFPKACFRGFLGSVCEGIRGKRLQVSCEGRCRELFRRALRGEEDVFVYSTHPDSHAIILSHYGQWDDVLVRSSAIGSRGGVPSQLRLPRLLHNQTSTPRLQMGPMASTPGSRGPQPFCLWSQCFQHLVTTIS